MSFSQTISRYIYKQQAWRKILYLFILLVASCSHIPQTESWKRQYGHLEQSTPDNNRFTETDYYIVFLVAAYHLDYLDNSALISSLIRYGRGKGNIGHSWILLKGIRNGRPYILELGQSGQRGKRQPRFYKGIHNYIQYGYSNPTHEQKQNPRYEPNPIKYLWEELDDGFLQKGTGGHRPTYAAKVDLTKKKFFEILDFIDPERYPYESFSLVGNNCSSYLAQVASLAGLNLDHRITVKIDPLIIVGNEEYRLWLDPEYSEITFSSPDIIERSLMTAVSNNKAEYALGWYFKR